MPKSLRKYVRKEKAKIRRKFFDLEEQKRQIEKLYQKIGFSRRPAEKN